MIKDKISNIDKYELNEFFKAFKLHITENFKNLLEIKLPLKAIPLTYDTKQFDLSKFENHQRNIDIHVVLEGEEILGITDVETLSPNMDYNTVNDYQLFDGEIRETIILRKGEFLILFPNEGHVTAGLVNESSTVKKIVFKVPI